MALILPDKSAWVRGGPELTSYGDLALCAITRLEILYSARSNADYEQLRVDLDAYRDLQIDTATLRAAEGAQRDLAARGQHRVPLPDVIIAACAARHGADVLHDDRHFELLGEVLGFRSVRLRR